MRRLTRTRIVVSGVAILLVAYLVVAYFFIPEIWIHRDASRIADFGPMVTTTKQDIPGDPINVGLVGSREDVLRAFASAGWDPADKITLRTSAEIGLSVVLDRPDLDAPVSPLLFEGRQQDLAFEKAVGKSADERHHVRFWKTGRTGEDGRPVWLGSASFDRGVGFSHDTGQITHHIAPDVDAERNLVIGDLQTAGQVSSTYEIAGIGATKTGRNGGGDPYFTDGKALIGVLHGRENRSAY
ncbi:LssY C-terminal domain-containing protein [Rhizobium cauense]|uniref:LssY C-terminal domain-containing protein n=1 Tax=Rhizobium cauense TaxID=1166683 RepID=UPI001C6E31E3|nr:LssY C-terminal domain-containing protein [Rhizobium cauense]MBW9112603.1 LssY C-terminal domain-containing protein [Rhizobium cauense]